MAFYTPQRIILSTASAIALLVIVGLVTYFTVGHLGA